MHDSSLGRSGGFRFQDILAFARAAAADSAMTGGRVTLRTLILIRWTAVIGQLVTVLVVRFGFGFALPLGPVLAVIGASALLNGVATVQQGGQQRLSDTDATLYLAYDTLQLSLLLYLTGGLVNPFAAFLLSPATIGATILSRRGVVLLTSLNVACLTVLAMWSMPLPWSAVEGLRAPLYQLGVWISLSVSVVSISIYVCRVAAEARRFGDALTESQVALAREQRLSALGGLAAAAAHELGSPLGTIAVVAKELAHELPPDSPHTEDVALLISQVNRCREILAELARRPDAGGGDPYEMLALTAFVEAVAAPHRLPAVTFAIEHPANPTTAEPVLHRAPEIMHGLGNFIQNAFQFAKTTVTVDAAWNEREVTLIVRDDGPGFPPHLLSRVGEPYFSGRSERSGHMGLGIFIAQTLLQKTGATVTFGNRRGGGARIIIRWHRADLETMGGSAT